MVKRNTVRVEGRGALGEPEVAGMQVWLEAWWGWRWWRPRWQRGW